MTAKEATAALGRLETAARKRRRVERWRPGLDTRPQDRVARARERWEDLRHEVQWLCAFLSRMLGTPRAEGLRLELQLAVEAQDRAWGWVLRWHQAELRR